MDSHSLLVPSADLSNRLPHFLANALLQSDASGGEPTLSAFCEYTIGAEAGSILKSPVVDPLQIVRLTGRVL